ncbi:MAG: amidohydrolase [Anaerolineae bacterium]|nr:amidohydrolase [Anaerolineae bacterium]
MLDKAQLLQDRLIQLRRTIHRQPELGFEEFQTGALVAQTLGELGLEFQSGVGQTGLVARLGNGNGPTIGIRADMDALPILEANEVEYKSQVPGKMHACGHDAHTAMLIGAAMLLKDEPFDGEIRLLFQPSEERKDGEGKSGATRMIDDGAIDGLDAVIALHVDGKVDRGKVSIGEGYTLANSDRIKAKIFGAGGHGAMPHLSRDPLFLVAPVLTAIHGIVSRWVDPIQPAVVTIGRLAGGTAANVIPGEVEMDFSVRSITDEVRQQLIAEIEQALSVARALGGDYSMEVHYGYPALFNDPDVTGWLKDTSARLIGVENVENRPLSMGGEDFAFMAQASRGAMMFLGAKAPDGPPKQFHHPEFDIDEEALPIGAAVLAQTALRFVRGEVS